MVYCAIIACLQSILKRHQSSILLPMVDALSMCSNSVHQSHTALTLKYGKCQRLANHWTFKSFIFIFFSEQRKPESHCFRLSCTMYHFRLIDFIDDSWIRAYPSRPILSSSIYCMRCISIDSGHYRNADNPI